MSSSFGDFSRALQSGSHDDRSMVVVTDSADRGIDIVVDELAAALPEPALLLVFARRDAQMKQTVATILERFPGVPLAGCTTSGIVSAHTNPDAPLQIVALGGPGFTSTTSVGEIGTGESRAAGMAAATAATHPSVVEADERHNALLLFVDGLAGDTADVVRGAYRSLPSSTPLVGGCAGDDLRMEATSQFSSLGVAEGLVVGAAVASSAHIGVGVSHGWTAYSEPMIVTKSKGTSLLELDDQPALARYLDVLGTTHDPNDGSAFARFAQSRPLGLQSASGHQIRFVKGCDAATQSLEFLVHVDEGELVWIMEGDRASVIDAAAEATRSALSALDGPPLGVVVFDCVARRGVIGDENLADETAAIADLLPEGTPIGGFYTYGEIARTGGALGFHHQTMVVLAFQ